MPIHKTKRQLAEHVRRTANRPTVSQQEGVGFSPSAHVTDPRFAGPGWAVKRSPNIGRGSGVSKDRRIATVPLGGTRHEEIVRLHEAEHLTATDYERLGKRLRRAGVQLSLDQLRALEEIRVNGRLTKRGLVGPDEWVQVHAADGDPVPTYKEIHRMALGACTPDDVGRVANVILVAVANASPTFGDPELPPWATPLARAARAVFNCPDDWPTVRNAAREIQGMPARKQLEEEVQSAAKDVAGLFSNSGREVNGRGRLPRLRTAVDKTGLPKGNVPTYTELAGEPNWGDMKTHNLPLTTSTYKPGEGRRWAFSDDPTNRLVRPHRLVRWGDRVGFKRRTRKQGTGSFLCDASGSMRWKIEDLLSVLEAMPRANVGVYAGHHDRGDLLVVAKEGRRASRKVITEAVNNTLLGANVVDGPALEWLAKQPEPRVWVSDGAVTEVGDDATSRALVWVARFCKKHRIKMVHKKVLLPDSHDD